MKMQFHLGKMLAPGLAAGLAAAPASATTYSAAAQFSAKQNTAASTWSYRFGDGQGHDGNYMLLTSKGTLAVKRHGKAATLKDWDTPGAAFGVPFFASNKAATAVTFVSNGQTISLAGQSLIYHPGYGFPAIESFLAPAAGTATITYNITALDWSCGGAGAGINWSIERNSGNGALASGFLISPNAQSIGSTGTRTISVSVAAGDRINFIVDGAANPPNCASTGLQATIALP